MAEAEPSSSLSDTPAPVAVSGQASLDPDFPQYRQHVLEALPRQPSEGLEATFVETAARTGFDARVSAQDVADTLLRSGLLPERRGAK